MAYVTNIERFALKRGREEGKVELLRKFLPTLLKNGVTENDIINETGLTSEQIQSLKEAEEVF